jgi:orotate phosphoribosyltransferase
MNQDLVRRMIEVSQQHGEFVLSSGATSMVYFDKFLFLTRPDLLRDVAKEVASLIPDGVDHLASPEGAAMLLVSAVSLEAGLPSSVIRKTPKEYGTKAQVEGYAPAGARVALLEDVVTTGHQVLRAAKVLEAHGVTVEIIILALDRGGADPLREAGYRVASVASLRPEE